MFMNKNLPLCMLAYVLSFLMFFSSESWFSMWLAMELNTLVFVSVLFLMSVKKMESALLYFLTQNVATILFLMALSVSENSNMLPVITNLLFLCAVFIKLGIFPFHWWVLPVIKAAATFIVVLVLILQKLIPFFWLYSGSLNLNFFVFLMVLLNLMWVSPMNFQQNKMKNIITLSSITHTSWMVLAMLISFSLWFSYFFLYSLIFLFFMLLLQESRYSLLKKKNSFFVLVLFLSLGGLPPMVVFFPKLLILLLSLKLELLFFVLVLIFLSLLDLYVYITLSLPLSLKKKKLLWWSTSDQTPIFLFSLLNLSVLFFMML